MVGKRRTRIVTSPALFHGVLSTGIAMPDAKTIWLYRERSACARAAGAAVCQHRRTAAGERLVGNGGQVIDET
jgi:hypothetical protein